MIEEATQTVMEDTKKLIDKRAFLVGKTVYLRPPDSQKDVLSGDWFSWFNDKATTRYINQGAWPNTIEKQTAYVEALKHDRTRLVLCIVDRRTQRHRGVVSFSSIDLLNRRAQIAIVMGAKRYPPEAPIEAMALMTQHAFDRLNLLKLNAGQCEELWKWINILELIGYRIEGYTEVCLLRDGRSHHGVYTGITAERFYRLKQERGGRLLPDDIQGLLRRRRKENLVQKAKAVWLGLYGEQRPEESLAGSSPYPEASDLADAVEGA